MASVKFCVVCGSAVDLGATVCAACGADVRHKQKRYTSPTSKCPFYRHEMNQIIICDGPVPNSSIRICFSNGESKTAFACAHCRKNYTECPVYQSKAQN